ncbi:MAG: DUF494 domain-containing protein [Betaproteobacteria bacterium]|nr:DUF494 domain-containing protein [Betaproteobacteria bacterium]
MFEVLVFVFENYWRGDAIPELPQLERKLTAVGFESDEIREALRWLDGLNFATRSTRVDEECEQVIHASSAFSMRVYSSAEQDHLGAAGISFISFLDSAGVLPPEMREVVIDRAMELKIIVMMVYWSFGEEPDALVLDELCDDAQDRIAH